MKERQTLYLDTCYQAIWLCFIVNKILTPHIIYKIFSLEADYDFAQTTYIDNLAEVVMKLQQLSGLEHLYLVLHINQPLLLF